MGDAATSLTNSLADRYTIERELGHGGMATVYLAEERKHKRKVAIKVLRPELGASVGAERFLREIGIAARLSHPHIVPLIDSGESDGSLYYVSPYVAGGSLRDRLNAQRQAPDRRRAPHRARGRRRARLRAPQRVRAPRREAGEHPLRRRSRAAR